MNNQLPEEITLRDVLLLVGDYFRYFLRRWYFFLIIGLLGGGWFAWGTYKTEGTYGANLRFSLNEEPRGSAAGLGSVLGQFGLGGSGSGPNYLKLVEIARSPSVLNELLFDSIIVGADTVLTANHIIDLYNYHETWAESDQMAGFLFINDDPKAFDRRDNRAMQSLQSCLRGNTSAGLEGLCEIEFDGESGIIKMKVTTLSEGLTLHLAREWYAALSKLYILQSVAPQKRTLAVIESKVDSIRGVLDGLQARYARLEDRRAGVVLRNNLTEIDRVRRELGLNQIIYGESVKNQEQARFLLANQTPAFSIIEAPVEPISINEPSLITSTAKGGIIGGILAGIILFCLKLYRDTINEE